MIEARFMREERVWAVQTKVEIGKCLRISARSRITNLEDK